MGPGKRKSFGKVFENNSDLAPQNYISLGEGTGLTLTMNGL
jgi:hypothetical protein